MCTPLNPFPGNTICNELGDAPFNFIAFGNTPPYLTPAGCANLCTQTTNCLSFFLSTDYCILYAGTQENNGFTADGSSAYTGYDLACFNCQIITTTATPSSTTTSSAQPSATCPPAGAICNTIGDLTGNFAPFIIDSSQSSQDTTLAGCSALCAGTVGCQSWLLGDTFCIIFNADETEIGFVADPQGSFQGSDATCLCVSSSSLAPSATQSTTSAQPSATCPPAGAICNTIGDLTGNFAPFIIDSSQSSQDTTLAGCSALCAGTVGCQSWLLGDTFCIIFNADETEIGFVADPQGSFQGSDATCLCVSSSSLAPSATSSATISLAQQSTTSAQPSATCIPPVGAICNSIGDFPGDPTPFIIDQSANPGDTTLAGCSALCSTVPECLSWDLGGGFCFLLNADQADSGFVADPQGAFEGSDAACLKCVSSTTSAQLSTTSSAQSSSQPSVTCVPPVGAICNGIGGFPGDPTPFIIDQSANPGDTTLAGCSALCSTVPECLSWDLGGGFCFLLNADQADSGFVADPQGAFEGSDAACLKCVSSTTSAQLSTTSSAQSSSQPSVTCVPPVGAICNGIGGFPGDPTPFIIDQSANPGDTTLAGCSALCSTVPECLSWDLGGGFCFLLNADQVDSGFVADPQGAFEGSDAACLRCVSSTTSAQLSTTSLAQSSQPSATCIPPVGAICNGIGDFPGDPTPFIIDQSSDPDDTTLAGCSALCSTVPECLSWDLGGGFCFLLNADQADSGFVADPQGAFEGSDAACLICISSTSSAQSTTQLSTTTSLAQPSAQPSSIQASSSASAMPSSALPLLASSSLASPSAFALPSTFATPVSSGSPSVLNSRNLSLSTIQQSSVQTAISATMSQAVLLSATISVATALASSIFGQSSVPIAFVSAPKSQASLKYSNYSVSIGSFSGALQTPSAIASVTLGAVISSSTTALPSVTPFSGFIRVINPALPAKRQLHRPPFLKVNVDGTVSRTRTCSSASIFNLGTNGQLTSNGLTAFATPGDIVNGISDFTFGLNDPANIQTTFALSGDILEWNNNAFTSHQAIFAFPPIPPFVLNAIFDGTVPDGYTAESLQFLAPADAGCGISSTTGTVAATLMTTSTVCTTIVYTITKCPPTVYNCPIGHKTTETIPLYTTLCPVDPAKPAGPIYNIGVLVTIFIDITIVINIQNGVLETIFVTDIILSTENGLYNAATSAQPCYPCQLSSHGYKCPKSGVTVTQTVCRSCPSFHSLPTWAAPVVHTCNTCAPFTLFVDAGAAPTSPANLAPGLPAAMGPANGAAVPQADIQTLGQPPVNGAAVVTPAVDFPSQPAANVAAVITQEAGQNTPPQNAEGQFGGNLPAAASSLAGGVNAPASPQQASDAVRLLNFTMRAFIFFVWSIFWL